MDQRGVPNNCGRLEAKIFYQQRDTAYPMLLSSRRVGRSRRDQEAERKSY